MSHPDDLLRAAEEVLAILARHHLDAVLLRNLDLDLDEVRAVCAQYRLGGLEELIAESRSV